ncbi:MAG: hypothetical protein J07HQW2_03195 [Haloquadratum walsbyi J07HQW2]|uniref:Uncharacterized protein n=1 Tax=Haloquadratum walsbyi J07HQW2 TaxID=1238425 RepID=U1PSD3_9EURY|nr:MAG: hypothetical protein J07HQW2_03195 [Haloquadratum walsbyi J07HQW2]
MRLTRVVAFLESGDTAFDGLDSTPNPFLDEVCSQLCLVSELVVEGVLGLLFRGHAVVVRVSPSPLAQWRTDF